MQIGKSWKSAFRFRKTNSYLEVYFQIEANFAQLPLHS